MGIRKLLMLPAVLSLSAIFAFGAVAQQEEPQSSDKVRELQEQWHRIMKDEYNPSAIQPQTNGKPSFAGSTWMKSSKKSKGKKSKVRTSRKHSKKGVASAKTRGSRKSAGVSKKSSKKAALTAKKSSGKSAKVTRSSAKKGTDSSATAAKKGNKSSASAKKKGTAGNKKAGKQEQAQKNNKISGKKKNKKS